MAWIAAHRKLLVVVAGIVIAAVGQALGADSEAYQAAVAVAVALGVYVAPNA